MARHLLIVDRRRPRVRQTMWCSLPSQPFGILGTGFRKRGQTAACPRNSAELTGMKIAMTIRGGTYVIDPSGEGAPATVERCALVPKAD